MIDVRRGRGAGGENLGGVNHGARHAPAESPESASPPSTALRTPCRARRRRAARKNRCSSRSRKSDTVTPQDQCDDAFACRRRCAGRASVSYDGRRCDKRVPMPRAVTVVRVLTARIDAATPLPQLPHHQIELIEIAVLDRHRAALALVVDAAPQGRARRTAASPPRACRHPSPRATLARDLLQSCLSNVASPGLALSSRTHSSSWRTL